MKTEITLGTIEPDSAEPKKPFYVIRRTPLGAGFFSNFLYVLGHIIIADEKGYTPVIDMLNYKTLYSEDNPINNTYNAWEYYFKQVDNITLGEAYESKDIIMSNYQYQFDKVPYYGIGHNELPSKQMIELLNKYIEKYILIQPHIMSRVDKEYEKFRDYKKVLGVHMRGADMNYTPEHPKQPTIQDILLKVERIIEEHDVDGIFICTDEQINIDIFKKKFHEKIIESNAFRAANTSHLGIHINTYDPNQRKNHKYLLGEEVLIDMLLLSQCNILLCGPSNVAYVASIFNNNQYEKMFLL